MSTPRRPPLLLRPPAPRAALRPARTAFVQPSRPVLRILEPPEGIRPADLRRLPPHVSATPGGQVAQATHPLVLSTEATPDFRDPRSMLTMSTSIVLRRALRGTAVRLLHPATGLRPSIRDLPPPPHGKRPLRKKARLLSPYERRSPPKPPKGRHRASIVHGQQKQVIPGIVQERRGEWIHNRLKGKNPLRLTLNRGANLRAVPPPGLLRLHELQDPARARGPRRLPMPRVDRRRFRRPPLISSRPTRSTSLSKATEIAWPGARQWL